MGIIAFGDCEIDQSACKLRRGGRSVDVEPQVFNIIEYLAENPGRLVSKDELLSAIWGGRIVSESTISSRLSAARKLIGDTNPNERMIATVSGRGYRFDVVVTRLPTDVPSLETDNRPTSERQAVKYITTEDGISLAVAEVGQGFPVVKVSNWMSHIETDFQNPLWTKLFTAIAESNRLVRYDGRGVGLSDRNVPPARITFEKFVLDLETVIDSLDVERVSLLGVSMGAATALAYASRRPEKVHRLALHGGFPIGRRRRNSAVDSERSNLFFALMRQGWGTTDEAFMKAFAQIYLPSASAEELEWFARLQQENASADVAVSIRDACDDIDVSDTLAAISSQALVTHSRGDMVVPFDQGKYIASRLPNSEMRIFESRNHIILDREPEADRLAATVGQFLSQ